MILRFCICIPAYNNPKTVQGVVEACLDQTQFPIVVVDDGSDEPIDGILEAARSNYLHNGRADQRISILRHERNKGKGAALKTAIAYALSKAYTHIITIDADGQHSAGDIKQMVSSSLANPWDIIIGFRQMDPETTPGVSKFGRKFSNFWLWYQTKTYVSDSQSGFRVYPLFHLQNVRCLTKKFDFELEVLARLLWRGVGLQSVPVGVQYFAKEERVSHFHKFYDNVRITLMNIIMIAWSLVRYHGSPLQVFLSMVVGSLVGLSTSSLASAFAAIFVLSFLLRSNGMIMLALAVVQQSLEAELGTLGSLLSGLGFACLIYFTQVLWALRKDARVAWTGKIRGGRMGNLLIAKINSYAGQYVSYALMVFVVPYFFLFAPKARRSSFELAERLVPRRGFLQRILFALRHMFVFASIMLDRLYQSRRRESCFDYVSVGGDRLIKAKDRLAGTVLVTAHFGALDMVARATKEFGLFDKLVRAEFVAESDLTMESILKRRERLGEEIPILSQKEQSVLLFKQLIEQGKSIVMMGDRPINQSYELVLFLGKLAAFDTTPYRVAHACQAKVLYCFGVKRSMWVYDFVAEDGSVIEHSADQAVAAWRAAQNFANCLERHVRVAPYQWANFFGFWSEVPRPPMARNDLRPRTMLWEQCKAKALTVSQPQSVL